MHATIVAKPFDAWSYVLTAWGWKENKMHTYQSAGVPCADYLAQLESEP